MIKKSKLIFQIVLGIIVLTFTVAACNNSSENKSTSDSTTMKSDTTMSPMTDTSKMMDTTNKMDTGKTKPTVPGN
jgi:ABC-type Fe3+-citrate transport system substrate-binding protein